MSSDSRRLIQSVVIGGLAGLAVFGMVYLIHALARHSSADSASILEDCRHKLSELESRLTRPASA